MLTGRAEFGSGVSAGADRAAKSSWPGTSGIIVEAADDDEPVVLRAPLAPNANHKGTAFGGSLYSLAVLTGWAWAHALSRDAQA